MSGIFSQPKFAEILQQMYTILQGNRSPDQKRRLTKNQDGGVCHLEFINIKTSLKIKSVANTTIFANKRWRLSPFCILVNAFNLVCSSFFMLEYFKNFEKFKNLIHNYASEVTTS